MQFAVEVVFGLASGVARLIVREFHQIYIRHIASGGDVLSAYHGVERVEGKPQEQTCDYQFYEEPCVLLALIPYLVQYFFIMVLFRFLFKLVFAITFGNALPPFGVLPLQEGEFILPFISKGYLENSST